MLHYGMEDNRAVLSQIDLSPWAPQELEALAETFLRAAGLTTAAMDDA